MGNLMKGLKVAAYVAEIIVAGSVVIELAEKYSGKFGKKKIATGEVKAVDACLLYTSPSPRDKRQSRMPSSA